MIPDQDLSTARGIDRVVQEMYDQEQDADNFQIASPLNLELEATVTMKDGNGAFQALHHQSGNGLDQGMATVILKTITINPLQHHQQISLELNARLLPYPRKKKPTARSQIPMLS